MSGAPHSLPRTKHLTGGSPAHGTLASCAGKRGFTLDPPAKPEPPAAEHGPHSFELAEPPPLHKVSTLPTHGLQHLLLPRALQEAQPCCSVLCTPSTPQLSGDATGYIPALCSHLNSFQGSPRLLCRWDMGSGHCTHPKILPHPSVMGTVAFPTPLSLPHTGSVQSLSCQPQASRQPGPASPPTLVSLCCAHACPPPPCGPRSPPLPGSRPRSPSTGHTPSHHGHKLPLWPGSLYDPSSAPHLLTHPQNLTQTPLPPGSPLQPQSQVLAPLLLPTVLGPCHPAPVLWATTLSRAPG